MSKVYALFVGINEYQVAKPLAGCVEDIQSVQKVFSERIPEEQREFLTLLNADATRANIIDGFRTHLARAGKDDVALFYYCGHGSTEFCPDEWKRLEPSGMNQTYVSVDARGNGVYDLADKEVGALIHDVANGGAEIVVITDSCHSGGNTRDAGDEGDSRAGVARMTAAAQNSARTLNDYIEQARVLYDPANVLADGPPTSRHIAIAACQDNETAKEGPLQPPRRGVFTQSFEEALHTLGPSATYIDLLNSVVLKVRGRAQDQVPNLYVAGGASGHQLFLGGHAGRRDLSVNADNGGRWWLSAGAVDGIPSAASGSVTEVAIYERGAFDETSTPAAIATAVVVNVLGDRAMLNVTQGATPLDTARTYIGAITQLGTPALHVVVEAASGADEVAARVRSRLAGSNPLFAVVERAGSVSVVKCVVSGEFAQLCDANGTPLPGLRYRTDDAGLTALLESAVHLARWHKLRELGPPGSRLNGQVQVELVPVQDGETSAPDDRAPHASTEGTLALTYSGDKGPRMQGRVRNTANEKLYVALLNLTDTYECSVLFADRVPAGGVGYAFGGKAFRLTIKKWRDATVRSTTDYFKVVAATEPFDPERWTLPELLKAPEAMRSAEVDEEPKPVVRTADGVDAFWGTTLLKVVTTR